MIDIFSVKPDEQYTDNLGHTWKVRHVNYHHEFAKIVLQPNGREEKVWLDDLIINYTKTYSPPDAFQGLWHGHSREDFYNPFNFEAITDECKHPKKYLNKITTAMQFYVCPDCKKSWDK